MSDISHGENWAERLRGPSVATGLPENISGRGGGIVHGSHRRHPSHYTLRPRSTGTPPTPPAPRCGSVRTRDWTSSTHPHRLRTACSLFPRKHSSQIYQVSPPWADARASVRTEIFYSLLSEQHTDHRTTCSFREFLGGGREKTPYLTLKQAKTKKSFSANRQWPGVRWQISAD